MFGLLSAKKARKRAQKGMVRNSKIDQSEVFRWTRIYMPSVVEDIKNASENGEFNTEHSIFSIYFSQLEYETEYAGVCTIVNILRSRGYLVNIEESPRHREIGLDGDERIFELTIHISWLQDEVLQIPKMFTDFEPSL